MHTLKFWAGTYYWIPKKYIGEFSDLWLSVVARKTQSATGGPSATSSQNPTKQLQLQNLQLNNLNNQIQ